MRGHGVWQILEFTPLGSRGRERATIEDVVIVREGERFWIKSPERMWEGIDKGEADAALNLFSGADMAGPEMPPLARLAQITADCARWT